MKISYNWLKDYLPIDLPPEEVSDLLTSTGLEVEGLERVQSVAGGLEGLVVGEVLSAEKHPDADRLKVTSVNVGQEAPLPIVCGAPNVAAGQKVIVALPGTTLYPTEGDPFKIKKSKIRGEVSEGMICAEDEIGLGSEHDGIIVLDASTPVGKSAAAVFDVTEDFVFDIGLTPNRSDATGHFGVALDLFAVMNSQGKYKGKLGRPEQVELSKGDEDLPISVTVESPESCPRYCGISIAGIEVKESPKWLKDRLSVLGHRPINNIVDITNYILLDTGQPLHAFDLDKISQGKVLVNHLSEGTTFQSLDGEERKLSAEDLMISNPDGGMCIAGVFGGLNSGVTESTKNIFLESASFDSVSVRKTSKRHDLRTDAATRFEKGVDPNACLEIMKRAAKMITEIAGGTIASDPVDVYPSPIEKPAVRLRFAQMNKIAGQAISPEKVRSILTDLDMEITSEDAEGIDLKVGTNRFDVLREIDVIEEVLRIFGYDSIEIPQTIKNVITEEDGSGPHRLDEFIANFLSSRSYLQIMSNSISSKTYYEEGEPLVGLMNSLNKNLEILRKEMIFSGLEAIQYNRNRQVPNVRFYEIGKVYAPKEETTEFYEGKRLSVFLSGNKHTGNWRTGDQPFSFFDLKKDVETLLLKSGLKSWRNNYQEEHPFEYALHYDLGKDTVVKLGRVSADLLDKFDIEDPVYYAEIDLDKLLKYRKSGNTLFKLLPKYPSVRRDLALLLDKGVNFEAVEKIGLKTGKKLLQSIELFDIYEDSKIGDDKKSYAVSFTLQNSEKTLTDKEVDKLMQSLIKQFENELGAQLR